ncbi:MAG TPA: hypothetical protein VFX20_18160 [Steroidobacteraceae bacterium]|nr:hypothetical protein [Steroidobacteraceae bacterium]
MAYGPNSQTPVNTPLMGYSPDQLAKLTPAQRAKLLKRAKGMIPPGAPPAAGPAPGAMVNTILT